MGYSEHLKGLQWEVIVVDQPIFNAFCLPGGKIVVFTGLLKELSRDHEIATVLGHEVGHVVARHAMERITMQIFVVGLQLIAVQFFDVPGFLAAASDLLIVKPYSRLHEMEADRIGLILMAAAGFDPRLAPPVYLKMDAVEKLPEWAQYLATHPAARKRAEALRASAAMGEALRIYEQKAAGRSEAWLFMR